LNRIISTLRRSSVQRKLNERCNGFTRCPARQRPADPVPHNDINYSMSGHQVLNSTDSFISQLYLPVEVFRNMFRKTDKCT
jgi:hypothetical protein